MEFKFKCHVGELQKRNGKSGEYHKVSLVIMGFSHDFFVPDNLLPDLLIGQEQEFLFKVVKTGPFGLDVQLKAVCR